MTVRYLSLALVEIPDGIKENPCRHWLNIKSIASLRFHQGMIEITYADGNIQVFNREDTNEILLESSQFLNEVLSMFESLSSD